MNSSFVFRFFDFTRWLRVSASARQVAIWQLCKMKYTYKFSHSDKFMFVRSIVYLHLHLIWIWIGSRFLSFFNFILFSVFVHFIIFSTILNCALSAHWPNRRVNGLDGSYLMWHLSGSGHQRKSVRYGTRCQRRISKFPPHQIEYIHNRWLLAQRAHFTTTSITRDKSLACAFRLSRPIRPEDKSRDAMGDLHRRYKVIAGQIITFRCHLSKWMRNRALVRLQYFQLDDHVCDHF